MLLSIEDHDTKEENEKHWTSVIRQGMIAALLEKDIENYGLLKLTPKGERFLEDPYLIELYKDQDFEKLGQNEVEEEQQQSAQAYDEKLFELLKVERKRVAKSKGLPPYVIFQDPSLEEMATVYPTTKEELSQINGVGMGKVEKFGNSFLQRMNTYMLGLILVLISINGILVHQSIINHWKDSQSHLV